MSAVSSPPPPSTPEHPERAARRPQPLGRDFTLLWGASGSASLADGLVRVALPLVAVELTRSPALVAGVAVTTTLAWILVGLPAGALGDRLNRRTIAMSAALLRTVLLGAVGVLLFTDQLTVGMLFAAAFLLGAGEAFFDTSTPAMVPGLVPEEELPRAHGRRHAVAMTANELVGPAAGGTLFALSKAAPLLVSTVCHALSALMLWRMRAVPDRSPEPETRRTALFNEIRQGLVLLVRSRRIAVIALWGGMVNFAGSLTFAVLALHLVAPGPVGLDTWGFGLLMASLGLGGLIGALLAGRLAARVGELRLLTLSCALMAADSVALALTTQIWVIAVGLVVGSAAAAVFGVMAITALQRATPDSHLSRVSAGNQLVMMSGTALGGIAAGALGEVTGDLRVGFAVAAVLLLALTSMRAAIPATPTGGLDPDRGR
ncbi:MFS transporter [Nocardiopsis metallicus]|uniref:MFS transporter n=1 Tax=Nocardiopsis metallicus TaxID=179819 RepID=UPI0016070583